MQLLYILPVNPFISTSAAFRNVVTLGMGSERKDACELKKAAQKSAGDDLDFIKKAFEQITSIDLKKEEKGILSLSQDWQIPFVTYTEE